jgi:hypothetical protein
MGYSKINPSWQSTPYQNREWFHENICGSDELLITIGDSWTWGDSLGDDGYRLSHIYGYHLSNMLNSDWVNIGICGTSNMNVLLKSHEFIKNINYPYKKIHTIITLTESGRELNGSNVLNKEQEYNSIKGTSWPTFSEMIDGFDIKSVVKECHELKFEIGYDIELFHAIKNYSDINDLLIRYEQFTFELIHRLFDSYLVGRNFTHTYDVNKDILGSSLLEKTWTNVIAERGELPLYPTTRVLSMIGLDPLLSFTKSSIKEQWMTILNSSSMAIDWLDQSPYNSKIASKHPTEQAHQWWADYLFEQIKQRC